MIKLFKQKSEKEIELEGYLKICKTLPKQDRTAFMNYVNDNIINVKLASDDDDLIDKFKEENGLNDEFTDEDFEYDNEEETQEDVKEEAEEEQPEETIIEEENNSPEEIEDSEDSEEMPEEETEIVEDELNGDDEDGQVEE
ncbi:MAG: hypothetical protein EOL97_13230 [Spirochaetia bacterium]|nr:hypothetical protein [Spirochaetia bacterium]